MNTFYTPMLVLFSLLSFIPLVAQQQLQFNDFREHRELLNPAVLFDGYDPYHDLYVGVTYREQGMGKNDVPLKPRTLIAKGTWVGNFFKGGYFKPLLGANISSKSIGITQYNNINLRVGAVNLVNNRSQPGNERSLFSAALNLSANQFRINASETKGLVIEDPVLQNNYTQIIPNVGLGVYYNSRLYWKKLNFHVGASIPSVFSMNLEEALISNGEKQTEISPDFHLLVGFKLYKRNTREQRKNSFLEGTQWLFQDEYGKLSYDSNFRYFFSQYNIWIGTGYSSNQLIHSQIGFEIYKGWNKQKHHTLPLKNPLLRISIGYDYYVGNIDRPLENAFELSIHRLLPTR